ncbi:MAG: NADPH:quinone oxidoreductase family protein [Alphaproteobacteria bacterium]
MRALLCRESGPPENLTVEDIDPESMGKGEVRLAIHAAGLNFADTLMIAGEYQRKPPFPFSPGLEAAGVVTEVGAGVTRLKPGDRAIALVDWGAFRDDLVALERDVMPMPAEMDFVTGAGFGAAYCTAHGALSWQGRLKPGEVLLVHGAAGGVGLGAVEVGKAMGGTVIATASTPAKLALAKAHGADHLIDYGKEDFRARVLEITDGRGADVVFDPVGGDVFLTSLRCVAWDARLVIIGFASGQRQKIPANILLVKNIAAYGFAWTQYRREDPEMVYDSMDQLFDWWRAGKLDPHVSEVFDLADAATAMKRLTERKATGRIVLTTGLG